MSDVKEQEKEIQQTCTTCGKECENIEAAEYPKGEDIDCCLCEPHPETCTKCYVRYEMQKECAGCGEKIEEDLRIDHFSIGTGDASHYHERCFVPNQISSVLERLVKGLLPVSKRDLTEWKVTVETINNKSLTGEVFLQEPSGIWIEERGNQVFIPRTAISMIRLVENIMVKSPSK
jgi:hypothetical protein